MRRLHHGTASAGNFRYDVAVVDLTDLPVILAIEA